MRAAKTWGFVIRTPEVVPFRGFGESSMTAAANNAFWGAGLTGQFEGRRPHGTSVARISVVDCVRRRAFALMLASVISTGDWEVGPRIAGETDSADNSPTASQLGSHCQRSVCSRLALTVNAFIENVHRNRPPWPLPQSSRLRLANFR